MIKEFKIQDWMTSKLRLSGNNLVLFALMWKMSEQGTKTVKIDYKEITLAMSVSDPTVYNCLGQLVKRGLLEDHGDRLYVINAKCS